MSMQPDVLVISGPTASGKSALSVSLAQALKGEIVSADSMQIYRGMDIGTAKISPAERGGIVHHLLDVAGPEENWSVSRYVEAADACCHDISSRDRLPIIAGGTGLYIDSLISARSFSPAVASDPELYHELNESFDTLGGEEMLRRLAEFDPDRARKLSSGDRRRIIRAFEIYRLTGKTATQHDAETRALPDRYHALRIVLVCSDRELLYSRINSRVDDMVAAGLFDEVDSLLKSGLNPNCTAMQAIGYKECAAAIRGEFDREHAIELIKLNSRRYAKRQLTWFNRWENALRIDICRYDSPDSVFSCALDHIRQVGLR